MFRCPGLGVAGCQLSYDIIMTYIIHTFVVFKNNRIMLCYHIPTQGPQNDFKRGGESLARSADQSKLQRGVSEEGSWKIFDYVNEFCAIRSTLLMNLVYSSMCTRAQYGIVTPMDMTYWLYYVTRGWFH